MEKHSESLRIVVTINSNKVTKKIYIIAGVCLGLAIVLAMIFYIYRKNSPETPQSSTTPIQIPNLPSAAELREQGKTAIPSDGKNVIINDPYKNALKIVSGNADMKKTANYDIVYLGDLKGFVISLYGENLNVSRNEAEQTFLSLLGITKDEACKLDVTLAAAPEASKSAAGKDYGLSFCPNGKPFLAQ